MALASTDLFAIYRPSQSTCYKVSADALKTAILPDGTATEIMLKWDGTDWVITDSIDGGIYAA